MKKTQKMTAERNNIQQKDGIKGNLYGDYADADSHKNIIVDEDYEEYD